MNHHHLIASLLALATGVGGFNLKHCRDSKNRVLYVMNLLLILGSFAKLIHEFMA